MSHEHIARERDSPNEATQNLLKNIDNSPTQDKTSLYLPPADQLEMSEPNEDPQPINQLRLMCKELQNTIPPSPDGDASLKSGRSPSGRRTRKRKSCTNCCQPAVKVNKFRSEGCSLLNMSRFPLIVEHRIVAIRHRRHHRRHHSTLSSS